MQMNSLPIQVDHMGTGAFILLAALYLLFTGQMEGVGFLCSFVVRFVGVVSLGVSKITEEKQRST